MARYASKAGTLLEMKPLIRLLPRVICGEPKYDKLKFVVLPFTEVGIDIAKLPILPFLRQPRFDRVVQNVKNDPFHLLFIADVVIVILVVPELAHAVERKVAITGGATFEQAHDLGDGGDGALRPGRRKFFDERTDKEVNMIRHDAISVEVVLAGGFFVDLIHNDLRNRFFPEPVMPIFTAVEPFVVMPKIFFLNFIAFFMVFGGSQFLLALGLQLRDYGGWDRIQEVKGDEKRIVLRVDVRKFAAVVDCLGHGGFKVGQTSVCAFLA